MLCWPSATDGVTGAGCIPYRADGAAGRLSCPCGYDVVARDTDDFISDKTSVLSPSYGVPLSNEEGTGNTREESIGVGMQGRNWSFC